MPLRSDPGSAGGRHARSRPAPARAALQPVVLDADALYALQPFQRAAPTVLTPHTGELAHLLGVSARDVDAHRLAAVREVATRYGATVLLKGADTLVAAPREGVLVAGYGEPSLATAGTGDVLTGVIAAFLAKGMAAQTAAAAGAVAHGIASRLVEPARRRRRERPAARDPARPRRRGLGAAA